MNEAHFIEIEKVLFTISMTSQRTARAVKTLKKGKAEPHLIAAIEEAERDLRALHRRAMQGTYFAVTDQERLAV
ncbi:MAG: hypothetical protein ACR2K9_05365 [Solirubrobacteraceae bacterium]